jgi:hypothetical protein
MALDKDALSELLEAIHAGGDLDLVRSGLQLVLQALIEMEAAQAVGALPYQRSPERTTHRNGHRERLLSTKAGDLELRIPKLRSGSFSRTSPPTGRSHAPSGADGRIGDELPRRGVVDAGRRSIILGGWRACPITEPAARERDRGCPRPAAHSDRWEPFGWEDPGP